MNESAYEMSSATVRVGPGVTREVGHDLAQLGARHVFLVADPNLVSLAPVLRAREALEGQGIAYRLFDRVRVEPTDQSFAAAIEAASAEPFDAFLAVGGGSTIDTAKAANLYSTYPAPLLDYVNPPIGRGLPIPGPLRPLIAVPTTAGTGSETTGVAIFDMSSMHAKTGIAGRRLKPVLGLIDPENTATQPPEVAASCGLDVLSHAIESYTALPYTERPAPASPLLRPAYQGANPISAVWALEGLRMVARYLFRAVEDPTDLEARTGMLLASSYAGVGFGNAGVHLPHGMSYPVSGMVRHYRPPGYGADHAMVPHGISVILNAPAVFRYTAPADPERHLEAAAALGADTSGVPRDGAGEFLAETILGYMQRLKVPNGLRAIGYGVEDIPALVEGTLPQHRVTKLAPRPADAGQLARIFEDAMTAW